MLSEMRGLSGSSVILFWPFGSAILMAGEILLLWDVRLLVRFYSNWSIL
jgi:hypothetical protein